MITKDNLVKTPDKDLYNDDLAPVPPEKRTWGKWNLAALWVGMAVCIPTYLLASYMIRSGISWQASIIIIALANVVITIPMALNGHAGVKYGIPFPVMGRSSFGIKGIHIPSLLRGFVACGWFGVQTWVGGLSIYSIYNAITGNVPDAGLSVGQFISFGIFWLINIYFIVKGTESIKWLEDYSAPILILIGLILIYWGFTSTGSFSGVLDQGKQLQYGTAELKSINKDSAHLKLHPLLDNAGTLKSDEFRLIIPLNNNSEMETPWIKYRSNNFDYSIKLPAEFDKARPLMFQAKKTTEKVILSAKVAITFVKSSTDLIWEYILWFTAMVGFWATMSISISDITKHAKTQKDQIYGQFIGLPGTMVFYSFVGIFVTCAAVISFDDVLIAEDAPWDPVTLISKFDSAGVVIFAQVAMLIATLSTNIAANIIAPANALSNLLPSKINLKTGGIISGIIGIVICPWWLLNEISNILILVSGFLGPVLGILLCDYFIIRKRELSINDLYTKKGIYNYTSGFNIAAVISLIAGLIIAVIGKWVESLSFLYSLSWFTGFGVAFLVYFLLMRNAQVKQTAA